MDLVSRRGRLKPLKLVQLHPSEWSVIRFGQLFVQPSVQGDSGVTLTPSRCGNFFKTLLVRPQTLILVPNSLWNLHFGVLLYFWFLCEFSVWGAAEHCRRFLGCPRDSDYLSVHPQPLTARQNTKYEPIPKWVQLAFWGARAWRPSIFGFVTIITLVIMRSTTASPRHNSCYKSE